MLSGDQTGNINKWHQPSVYSRKEQGWGKVENISVFLVSTPTTHLLTIVAVQKCGPSIARFSHFSRDTRNWHLYETGQWGRFRRKPPVHYSCSSACWPEPPWAAGAHIRGPSEPREHIFLNWVYQSSKLDDRERLLSFNCPHSYFLLDFAGKMVQ